MYCHNQTGNTNTIIPFCIRYISPTMYRKICIRLANYLIHFQCDECVKGYINMDLTDKGCEHVDWIHLVQSRVQWQVLVNMVMNF